MYRVIRQVQLAGQARAGLALAHPAQQQNDLGWAQVLVAKHRVGVHAVARVAPATAMERHMTPAGLPKGSGVFHTRAALGTAQTARVNVFSQPSLAELVVADSQEWKIHTRRV